MPQVTTSSVVRYVVAVGLVALPVLLKWWLDPVIGKEAPLLFFYSAVMLSAWYGGFGPGLITTLLSTVAMDYFFMPPYYQLSIGRADFGRHLLLSLFMMEGTLICWLAESLKLSRQHAHTLIRTKEEILGRERLAHATAGSAEKRYRDLVNGLEGIVWEAEPQTFQFTFVSQRAEAILGYPISQWLSQTDFWVNLIHPDDREATVQVCRQAAAEGRDHDFEYRAIASDGRVVWLRDLVYGVRDADGRLRHLRGLMIDVTERKQAEEKCAQLSAIVESSQDAIIGNALDGTVTTWNEGARRIFGYSPEEMLGQPVSLLCPPERLEEVRHIFSSIREGQPAQLLETERLRKDGRRIHVALSISPIKDPAGKIIGVSGIAQDITRSKQGEQALRESAARFRHLADAMPQIVWAAQPDGRLDYFNKRWYDFTGFPEGPMTKEAWASILHSEDYPLCRDRWHACVQSGEPYQIEYRLKDRTTGGYRWYLGRALPVRDEAGTIVRWFGTCTDIDDQKRSEEDLKEADRRKDEFLAMLSHELRNPLAPIRTAMHILRLSRLDDPELVEARDVVDRQVHQLARIVDDLLDIFRITQDKLTLHKETLDLAQVIRLTVADHRSALESTRLTVTQDLPEEPVWVLADRTRLTQVVSNLLNNAAKFTNGGDRVTVRLHTNPKEQRAAVTVRDTGIGIPAQVLPHIFETFTQVDQSIDRRRGGLGLGLAMVKGLVELHGGKVQASSPGLGGGTEISFCLPLSRKPKEPGPVPSFPVPSTRHLRILIVEDNWDSAKALDMLLRRYGHEVAVTASGPAGLAAALNNPPDVVLCDLGLPEMDGFEVARELRRQPATAGIRLIAISGYGQEEDRRHSEAAGFDLHLTKPVDPAELQRLLAIIKVGRENF